MNPCFPTYNAYEHDLTAFGLACGALSCFRLAPPRMERDDQEEIDEERWADMQEGRGEFSLEALNTITPAQKLGLMFSRLPPVKLGGRLEGNGVSADYHAGMDGLLTGRWSWDTWGLVLAIWSIKFAQVRLVEGRDDVFQWSTQNLPILLLYTECRPQQWDLFVVFLDDEDVYGGLARKFSDKEFENLSFRHVGDAEPFDTLEREPVEHTIDDLDEFSGSTDYSNRGPRIFEEIATTAMRAPFVEGPINNVSITTKIVELLEKILKDKEKNGLPPIEDETAEHKAKLVGSAKKRQQVQEEGEEPEEVENMVVDREPEESEEEGEEQPVPPKRPASTQSTQNRKRQKVAEVAAPLTRNASPTDKESSSSDSTSISSDESDQW